MREEERRGTHAGTRRRARMAGMGATSDKQIARSRDRGRDTLLFTGDPYLGRVRDTARSDTTDATSVSRRSAPCWSHEHTFSTEEEEEIPLSRAGRGRGRRCRRRRTRHHPLFRHTDAHSLGDDGLASSSRCCHGDAAAVAAAAAASQSGSKARYRQPMNGGGGGATLRSAADERRGVRANVVAVAAAADRRFRDGLYGSAPI